MICTSGHRIRLGNLFRPIRPRYSTRGLLQLAPEIRHLSILQTLLQRQSLSSYILTRIHRCIRIFTFWSALIMKLCCELARFEESAMEQSKILMDGPMTFFVNFKSCIPTGQPLPFNILSSQSEPVQLPQIMNLCHESHLQPKSDSSSHNRFFNSRLMTRRKCCVLQSICLLYTSPSPRDGATSRMPSSA